MRTYDDWKTTEPDNEPFEECDFCHQRYPLSRIYLVKRNVWACEDCCQANEEDEMR